VNKSIQARARRSNVGTGRIRNAAHTVKGKSGQDQGRSTVTPQPAVPLSWEEASEKVLNDRADLWKRLADR
jgi:hypothetical protein